MGFVWKLMWLALLGCGRFGFDATSQINGGDDAVPLVAPQSVSAGPAASCAVLDDGSLWCWGKASTLGSQSPTPISTPKRIGTGSEWVEVAVDSDRACARKTDGSMWCWGTEYSYYGQGNAVDPMQLGTDQWKAVATSNSMCGIRSDDTLWCRQTFTGSFVEILPGQTFRKIVGKGWLMCAIDMSDHAWCWGDDLASEAFIPPTRVENATFREISVGASAFGIHVDGTLWSWAPGLTTAMQLSTETSWTSVASGNDYVCGLRGKKLWCLGNNHWGQFGALENPGRDVMVAVEPARDFEHLSSGGNHTCASRDGVVACAGYGANGELGDGIDRWSPVVSHQLSTPYKAIQAGGEIMVAIGNDDRVAVWGTLTPRSPYMFPGAPSPTPVGTSTFKSVAAYYFHAYAVRTDGTLWRWGTRSTGTGYEYFPTPTRIGASSAWTAVSGGEWRGCGLQNDGSVWCWGSGLIGDGMGEHYQLDPLRIGNEVYAAISTGFSSTCGVGTDSSLWCWGYNVDGALGVGNSNVRLSPVQPNEAGPWLAVSVGDSRACAIKTDRSLWCWGKNGRGVLGDGTTNDRYSPTQVGTATDWSQISSGRYHTCAIKLDGTLWCWGWNLTHAIDESATETFLTPVRVGIGASWTSVTLGDWSTCARDVSNIVTCWGDNKRGQLGDGRTWTAQFVSVSK